MAVLVLVQVQDLLLVGLGLLFVVEAHLDEAKASTFVSHTISHNDRINNITMSLEVLDHVLLSRLKRKASNKELGLIIWSLIMESGDMSSTARNDLAG